MLIIGHRGAAGLAPENTLTAMQAGMLAGADMLEFDVRLTSDGVPVVIHDMSTRRTHRISINVGRTSHADLQKQTATQPIPTLSEILDMFFGKITLNIELKSRGSGDVAAKLVASYIKQTAQWEHVLFSSFHASELTAVRSFNKHAKLAMLQRHNPFAFVTFAKKLNLSAVGFFQLTVNPLAVAIAKKRGMMTYAYTVNRPATARLLEREGIEGIVTNRPDLFKQNS